MTDLAKGTVRVWCEGKRNTEESDTRWLERPLNEEHWKPTGVRKDGVFDIRGPPGYFTTGNYIIDWKKRTPGTKKSNKNWHCKSIDSREIDISNIYLVCDYKKPGSDGYKFRWHIGTAGWGQIPCYKGAPKDIRKWLIDNGWTHGKPINRSIRGIANVIVKGEFKKTWYPDVTGDSGWVTHEVDKTKKGWQVVKDYSYLGNNIKDETKRWNFDVANKDDNLEFRFTDKCVLEAKYTDEAFPEISGEVSPAPSPALVENFRPTIKASFTDNGGSGINLEKFHMVIDEDLPEQRIDVVQGKQGLKSSEEGFEYTPTKDLTVGTHTVRLYIEDHHENFDRKTWWFNIIMETPLISNIQPLEGEEVADPRPTISGNFVDRGTGGIDLDSFELYIDDRETPIKKGTVGLTLTENDFSYTPTVSLRSGSHKFKVMVADNYGNKSWVEVPTFTIAIRAVNKTIGELELKNLEGLGGKWQDEYINKGGFKYIGDIVNEFPMDLSKITGIPLNKTIDHVKRAQIACSQVRFARMKFSELNDVKIWDLANMTDEEIQNYFVEVDEQGQPIPEAQADIDELRENVTMLFICLDDSTLKNLTFGQVVAGQPEETYYKGK